jgi:hypothetical protein
MAILTKLRSSIEAIKKFPARMAGKVGAMGLLQRKALEYTVLFIALWLIYSIYLKSSLQNTACAVINVNLALLPVMLKFLFFTGWPFALLAGLDRTWNSKNAGHVFLAAYISTNIFWIHRYGGLFCPFSLPLRLLPYILGAVIGHKVGSWRHTFNLREFIG